MKNTLTNLAMNQTKRIWARALAGYRRFIGNQLLLQAPGSQSGVALIEYIMLLSLFVIVFAAVFTKFNGLLTKWFSDYVQTVIGPTV